MNPAARFSMRGIRKAFGGTVAVDDIDFEVAAGEVCALVGQNGAGKSTLMSILAGALQPDAGTMTLDGDPYRPKNPLDARRSGVTMIYQELSLAPHLSVAENISLGVEPATFGFVSRRTIRETAVRALGELGHGDIDPLADAGSLSVAEQQIVEIARALASGSRVLVLDEPTSSLGREDTDRLFTLIARLRRQGHAIVYISHFIEEVSRISDRVVVLRDGRVAGAAPTVSITASEIVRLMVGRSVDELYPRSARTAGEPVLEVDALVPGSHPLVLHRGEIVGIAGLVGAGRTRLLRTIFGLEPVARGRVRIAAARGAGMLSEDRKGEGLAVTLSVADNVTMSSLANLGPGPFVSPGRQRAVVSKWIERLAIRTSGPSQTVEELSGGNQQKVAFARLLDQDVDVFILDEPTRGIDVGSKAQIYELIDGLAARRKTIVMVSSYLPELLGLCDRIAVMRRGRLGPALPAGQWTEHSLMTAATGASE
jgi:ribose transport system ATP-binding protein